MSTDRTSTAERFWAKVAVTPSCWLWTAYRNPESYGRFGVVGGNVLAHRWAYEQIVGPIPEGLQLDHLCHDPSECEGGRTCPHRRCVNPTHLKPVTNAENVRRSNAGAAIAAKQRAKTHCPQGHPYSGDNLYVNEHGYRNCRACGRDYQRRYSANQKTADVS